MSLGLHEKLHPRGIDSRGPSREVVLRSFKNNLGLTPEQADEISMVLEDYRQYYESLQEQLDDLTLHRRNRPSEPVHCTNPAERFKDLPLLTKSPVQPRGIDNSNIYVTIMDDRRSGIQRPGRPESLRGLI